MTHDTVMKASDVARYAESKGWTFVRHGRGSHDIYSHPTYPYIVSIPNHGSKDVPIGTLSTIIKQINGTWRR